ncbi:hypothetical protein AAVH_43102, partial [Aphelenchoides avenae]
YVVVNSADQLESTRQQQTIYLVALIVAASSTLACAFAVFTSTAAALRSSYVLHRRLRSVDDSTVVMTLDGNGYIPSTIASSPRPFL